MSHKLPPLPVRILLVLLLVVGGYYAVRALPGEEENVLAASGTIEATIVNISAEMAGKVQQVLVEEGQRVQAGDPLFVLDESLLQAQRAVAVSQLEGAQVAEQAAHNALVAAQTQYQITLDSSLAQGKETRLQEWFSDPSQFEQPGWYYSREEQVQAMQAYVDSARQEVERAKVNLAWVSETLGGSDFLKAEQRLLDARMGYLIAQTVNNRAQNSATRNIPKGLFNRTHCGTNRGYFVENARLTNLLYPCTGDEHLGEAGRTLYYSARDELEAAQTRYNELLSTEEADRILTARAELSVAQEHYYAALDTLRNLQTGEQSTAVLAAQAVVDQAQAGVDQAQKAVQQAQANLDLLDAQIEKLTVYAPMEGVVLTRNVETGEYVQPGAVAIAIGDLADITITVYVPEDRYGQIFLGQPAAVRVDSFPGGTFQAEVIHIADQAEFTPRNVQTVEGRSATVYAIELKVNDAEGKLKVGMPADVVFE